MSERNAGHSTDYFGSKAPGVYRESEFGLPRRIQFATGVPAFLGLVPLSLVERKRSYKHLDRKRSHNHQDVEPTPIKLTWWPQVDREFKESAGECFLPYAVRGFFENGGQECYVVPFQNTATSLLAALDSIGSLSTIDLVCVPDLPEDKAAAIELQQLVVRHCETMGDRFAILDSSPGDDNDGVWTQWSDIDGHNGAIYYPWVRVKALETGLKLVPPCGHIAGVYARTDRARGVHKAPANEVLKGVLDLERHLRDNDQNYLNPRRVNCLRAFAGRGIRVWGARTLSGESAWTYINVRRLFLTAVRWIDWNMGDIVFEPNTPQLWARVERELSTYFRAQFRAGALKGRTPEEAFYVKCDAETNPPELRDLGQVVTEIGLAPNLPFEFVVIRLIHGEKGVTITGPLDPNNTLT